MLLYGGLLVGDSLGEMFWELTAFGQTQQASMPAQISTLPVSSAYPLSLHKQINVQGTRDGCERIWTSQKPCCNAENNPDDSNNNYSLAYWH